MKFNWLKALYGAGIPVCAAALVLAGLEESIVSEGQIELYFLAVLGALLVSLGSLEKE